MVKNSLPKVSDNDWTNRLFVQNAELFLPVLDSMKEQAKAETRGICKIFDEFQVPRGSKILDMSCGIGRHAIELAKAGYQVVGYDPSPLYIKKAIERARNEGLALPEMIRFYQCNVDSVVKVLKENGETNFNAIIIMFNSFGYLDEEHDILLLKNMYELASCNAVLILETENRDNTIKNFGKYFKYEFEEIEFHEYWSFNFETSYVENRTKFYKKNLKDKNLQLLLDLEMSQRLYSLHELKEIITTSGWIYNKCYGSAVALQQDILESQYIVTVSKKN